MGAVITPDPNNTNPVDVCAPSTQETWYGSAENLANPSAPPPPTNSFVYSWACDNPGGDCPQPYEGGGNSPYVSYNSTSFALNADYYIYVYVEPLGTDPNYSTNQAVSTVVFFGTACTDTTRAHAKA